MLVLRDFKGALPKLHPTLLPPSFARQAVNCRLRRGSIRPYTALKATTTLSVPGTHLRREGGIFWSDTDRLWVVPGPVEDERYYLAVVGQAPVVVGPGGAYLYPLALDRPAAAPAVAVTSGTVDPDLAESIVFAFTWVTALDEESQPSALSAALDWSPGVEITVNTFGSTPSGRGIDRRRIYRSVRGYDGTATLQFVGEIAVGTTSFVYDADVLINEPIASSDYDPPVDDLIGLTPMANGMIAGFRDRDLMFCEPYVPHAWPIKYRLQLDYDIRGLCFIGDSLIVATSGNPYIIQGSHPEAMVSSKVEENLPCVSNSDGIVDMGYACAYPSSDGLAVISSAGAQVVSRGIYTRELWNALSPSSFVAVPYDGSYLYLRETGSGRVLGAFDLSGEQPYHVGITVGNALHLCADRTTGEVYLLDNDEESVTQFDVEGEPPMTALWRSKRFVLPVPISFPWARTNAEKGSGLVTTTKVYAGLDLNLIHTFTTTNAPVRMPAGRLDDTFEIQIETTAEVSLTGLGLSIPDIA